MLNLQFVSDVLYRDTHIDEFALTPPARRLLQTQKRIRNIAKSLVPTSLHLNFQIDIPEHRVLSMNSFNALLADFRLEIEGLLVDARNELRCLPSIDMQSDAVEHEAFVCSEIACTLKDISTRTAKIPSQPLSLDGDERVHAIASGVFQTIEYICHFNSLVFCCYTNHIRSYRAGFATAFPRVSSAR